MRKGLILLLTVILIVVFVFLAFEGIEGDNITILSYKQVGEESKKLEIYVDDYETMNLNKVKEKQEELISKIEAYKTTKQDYETRLARRESNLAQMGTGNISDIDFLLVKVGNYATEHKINLLFELTKNISDANANEYILTDLNFKVEGIYFEIAQFIDKLEKDERLSFEIRDFKMVNGGTSELVEEGVYDGEVSPTVIDPQTGLPYVNKKGEKIYNVVTATFKVYGIPVKKSTLLELSAPASTTNTINTTNTTNTASAKNTSEAE